MKDEKVHEIYSDDNTDKVYNTSKGYNTNKVCVTNRKLVRAYAENTGEVELKPEFVRNYARNTDEVDTDTEFVKTYAKNTGEVDCAGKKGEMSQFSPFLEKISEVVKKKPAFIILREKDLTPGTYKKLAAKVLEICNDADVPCVLHYFYKEAIELGVKKIHLPLHVLEQMAESEKNYFDIIGVSTHSVEQAKRAEELGASYITAGHVFVTDCKKGLAPRGLGFLKDVCENVDIDVYAIGGISEKNMDDCISAGAKGVCMMSGYMK